MDIRFTDIQGNPRRITEKDAMQWLGCTLRTLQNYRDPARRDPAKWRFLELYATGRIIPEHWGAYIKIIGDTEYLSTLSGYDIPRIALDQSGHYYSMKSAEISHLKRTLEAIERENCALRQRLDTPTQTTIPNNVVHFPRTKKEH